MTSSAAEKLAGPVAKKPEEKTEKRRALGRGLESLLPGPRPVQPNREQRASSAGPMDAVGPREVGGDGVEKQIPHFVRNDNPFADAATDARSSHAGELAAAAISLQAQAELVHDVVTYLPLDAIEKNPYQTRQAFDEQTLIEMRDSIREHGVVQPIVVRPADEEGRYILVLGERRLRASRMAARDTIPALIRRLSPQHAAEMTVLENVVREDLNCLEQAQAFKVLSQEFQLTQAQIAERIGVSRETVANYMRLLRLPQKVKQYMLEERLTFSDARQLLALESAEQIERIAEEVVTKHLKWDEIEERVARANGLLPPSEDSGAQKQSRGARWIDPNVRAAQMEMERSLGMRVTIRDRNGKGKIVIEYASIDDYERVVERLRGGQ